MSKSLKNSILFLFVIVIVGQLLFILVSDKYTTPKYESKIFTTTGANYNSGDDLHKINEAAHYFGQTMIGWTKFPNFKGSLIKYASLPSQTDISMHVQERQNFVFNITTKEPIELNKLKKAKDFLQTQINDFNSKTNTKFSLTNLDYNQVKIERSYTFGALFTLILSIAVGLAILFLRREFFQPKLKL